MSIRTSGLARRSFIIGSRLWPPAITRASGPRRSSAAIAPSTLVARSYSNGAGVCIEAPLGVLDGRVGPDDRRARQLLGPLLAALGIQRHRGVRAVGRVAQRRPVGAGGGDRRLAAQARQ